MTTDTAAMTHVYRWRKTKFSPLHPRLQGRFGERCEVLARGKNGNILIRFTDGYMTVTPRYAVRRGRR